MKAVVVIAEKPSLGRDVAAWIAKKFSYTAVPVGRSHIEVGPYKVSWMFGHLLENVEPHDYAERYKKWAFSDLPIIPDSWKLAPKADAAAQIRALRDLLKTATEVIGLGDPDPEGQLLQDEFLRWAGNKAPVNRLWLPATDDATIEKAWAAMKPNSHYEGYYWSALARSHADWLAGINLSRACTLASRANGGNAVLSVGRVQTPTLALIVQREKDIRAFKSVDFYSPFIKLAATPGFKATWAPNKETDGRLDDEGRLLSKPIAQGIADVCKKAGEAQVVDFKGTKGKEQPPLPFCLSSLQEHMSARYGMGVQDVLKYAQSLYEKKIASYPRTDSEYIPASQHEEAPVIFKGLRAGIKELGSAPDKADLKLVSRAFDDKKVSAHHAILPRPVTLAQLTGLSVQERQVWTEVAKRYLLQFFPAAEFLLSEIELLCATEKFKVGGKVYLSRGWKDAFAAEATEDEDELAASASLPKVAKGDVLKVAEAGFAASVTKPPKRFTEGTLVVAMKNVHKHVSDTKLKAILRENIGIGTEATRANVIGELLGRKFIEPAKKDIKPTELGEQLIDALPRQIAAPDMTALWQQAMEDIRTTHKPGYDAFIAGQSRWLTDLIREVPSWFTGKSLVRKDLKPSTTVKETAHTCLKCGGALNHVHGKFGWFFGCRNEDCKAIFKAVDGKPVEKAAAAAPGTMIGGHASGSKCPKCGKGELQVRTCGPTSKTPGKQFLACSNYFAKGKAKCDHSIWP